MARTEFLTIDQVRAELGEPGKPLSRATFSRWRANGKFPKSATLANGKTVRSIRLPNGQIRIPAALYEYFLAAQAESA